jgi:hypothetical protein
MTKYGTLQSTPWRDVDCTSYGMGMASMDIAVRVFGIFQ